MTRYVYVGWFFAGALLTNAIPHIVKGICGERFAGLCLDRPVAAIRHHD
jgi:hypothetical protein